MHTAVGAEEMQYFSTMGTQMCNRTEAREGQMITTNQDERSEVGHRWLIPMCLNGEGSSPVFSCYTVPKVNSLQCKEFFAIQVSSSLRKELFLGTKTEQICCPNKVQMH